MTKQESLNALSAIRHFDTRDAVSADDSTFFHRLNALPAIRHFDLNINFEEIFVRESLNALPAIRHFDQETDIVSARTRQ